MRVAVGCDHAGLNLKQTIAARLKELGHTVEDFGVSTPESSDYPEQAAAVAKAVAGQKAERGVLVCGSGVGMCIAANRFAGVRAVNATLLEHARLARQHNNANLLCLGERLMAPDLALEILDDFLSTEFEGGRHQRRLDKIEALSGGGA